MTTPSHFRSSGLVALFVAMAIGCTSPVAQEPERVVGLIEDVNPALHPLDLPDTVQAGVPFAATVTTFGPRCEREDGADVQTTGLSADVTPYDLWPVPGAICADDIHAMPRSVVLTFALPGSALVRLHGRGLRGDVTVQGPVTVRP